MVCLADTAAVAVAFVVVTAGLSITLDAPTGSRGGGPQANRFKPMVLFQWKGGAAQGGGGGAGHARRSSSGAGGGGGTGAFLFIAHDNPQLGSTVAASFARSETKSMHVMIESKDEQVYGW